MTHLHRRWHFWIWLALASLLTAGLFKACVQRTTTGISVQVERTVP